MALWQNGQYWYGESPADVWDYFVWLTRDLPEPVNHWRQAICACGNGTFAVWGEEEEIGQYQRQCTACDVQVVMFANEWSTPKKWRDDLPLLECICFGEEFEVVGVTMPFGGSVDSARTFYLGLRCTACGCLGSYAEWNPRYNDHAAYLAML
jgi:hypothetical protein